MSARDSILAKLRAAAIPSAPTLPDVAAWFDARRRHEDVVERTARLRAALEAVHTEIHDVTHDNWAAVLLQVAASKGLRQMLLGAGTPHGEALAQQAPEGLEIIRYEQPIDAWQDLLFDGIDASLTLARGGIAETGSLILWPTAAEPRLMSLVPSTHFVLLDVDTIHADFYSAMTNEGWASGMPTNALLICGPSKTADIQQTLAYGAHGPRELVVLLRHTQVPAQGAAA